MRVAGVFAFVVALLVVASCEQPAKADVAKDVIDLETNPETGSGGGFTDPDQRSLPAVDVAELPDPAATDEQRREAEGQPTGDLSGALTQESHAVLDGIVRSAEAEQQPEHTHEAGRQPSREAENGGTATENAGSSDSLTDSGHNTPHESAQDSDVGEPSLRDRAAASGSDAPHEWVDLAAEQRPDTSRGGADADGTATDASEAVAAAADDAAQAAPEPVEGGHTGHPGREAHDELEAAQAHLLADYEATGAAADGLAVPAASRAFLCRVCGSTVFHAADHLRDLRLPTHARSADAAAGGGSAHAHAHAEPAASAPRYVQAAPRAEAALGPRGVLLEVEGHPAFRGTPGHVYEAERQTRGAQASSSGSGSSSSSGSGSGSRSSSGSRSGGGGRDSEGSSIPGASGQLPPQKPQGQRQPQSTPRPPYFLAAAFDSGIGITLGAAESKEGVAAHAPPPPLPGYSARSVHCGRCGAMLGHLVVQRTASSRRTAGDEASANAGAGAGGGGAAAAAGLQHPGATGVSSDSGSEGAAVGGGSAAQPTGPPPPPAAVLAAAEPAEGGGAGTMHGSAAGSVSGGSAGAAAAAAAHSAVGVTVRPYVAGEEAAALRHLRGACLRFGSGGWWQYEWCVGRHVRQFHADPATGQADPDWSLGTYDPSAQADRVVPPPPPAVHAAGGAGPSDAATAAAAAAAATADGPLLYYSSQFYRGGQRCDENGKRRATEVQLFCCPRHRDKGALIASISEPSLCRYALAVCIPELCVDSPVPGTPIVMAGHPPQLQAQAAPQGPIVVKPAVPVGDGGGATAGQVVSVDEPPRAAAVDSPAASQPEALKGTKRPQGGRALETDLPESFILAFWRALLGDNSADFAALLSGEPATGISPVRFGG